MDPEENLKAKFPAPARNPGPERAPHRSYHHAMGLTAEQIRQPSLPSRVLERGGAVQHRLSTCSNRTPARQLEPAESSSPPAYAHEKARRVIQQSDRLLGTEPGVR